MEAHKHRAGTIATGYLESGQEEELKTLVRRVVQS